MMEALGGVRAREIAERFWTDPTPEGAAEYIAVCLPLYNPGETADWGASRRALLRTEVMFHFIKGEQRNLDLLGGLGHVRCPTLVLAGRHDPITPVACSEAILAALPPGLAELEVFEAAGHGVHRDEPERAEARLRAFLQA
jgi:proline iminopeptidase